MFAFCNVYMDEAAHAYLCFRSANRFMLYIFVCCVLFCALDPVCVITNPVWVSQYITFTAVHTHDSGPASARSYARIQLDPKLAGCTMTVHVCGPIGNGCASEARFVARNHTLILRLPTPYGSFGSSTSTVRLSTRPRTGLFIDTVRAFNPRTPIVTGRSTPYSLAPHLARALLARFKFQLVNLKL